MCGRYVLQEQGEVFPTDLAPVLVMESGRVQARPMRWGFPRPDGKGVVINARQESALQKNMFRQSLLERRAAVPTAGFYEWRREGGKTKEKYLFRDAQGDALYLAGLWRSFVGEDGTWNDRFVILTTAANGDMAPYHNRMPVLLREDERDAWLSGQGMEEIMERVPDRLSIMPMDQSKRQLSLFDDIDIT